MTHQVLAPVLFAFLVFFSGGCKEDGNMQSDFPGTYPGKARSKTGRTQLVLSNNALKAVWNIENRSIILNKLTNKYDNETVDLSQVVLFAVELENGQKLTNHDFHLQGEPECNDIAPTDSLPTRALGYKGKEISALLHEKNGEVLITWRAQLRDGSNYIRQQIEIEAAKKPVIISRIIFFDGMLTGARVSGLVPGSPVEYRNFIFGLEYPVAHSKALMTGSIGNISRDPVDVSGWIDGPGDYLVSVEPWYPLDGYDIESVALTENEKQVAIDQHPLTGDKGSVFYQLHLNKYHAEGDYQLRASFIHSSDSSFVFPLGSLSLHRKNDNILNFYIEREEELIPGERISVWSMMGVAPPGQKRRSFQYYLERGRARPYKQFLHYNSWWDLTSEGVSNFSSEQLIERMHAWNNKFIEPFNVGFQSFVFDDGWDDLDSVWFFDPVKFPDGFTPQAKLCATYHTGIGVWMSPFGGYGENKKRRLESAHREGLETNAAGLSLAGPRYYNRFLDRALDMLNNYHVNYFKFDGFGGADPEYLPDMEAGARLIETLKEHNPDVFVNITVGSWPSPFWLKYADCIWRGSADIHMAGTGSNTQQFMTYRDGMLYDNIVQKAPYYPLNSVMTAGIVYANLGYAVKCVNDDPDDFSDMVWSAFGAGSALQELYISHDRMKPEFWPVLAEAAIWAKQNEDVLRDSHWIGGSPMNLEVYGFASWSPEKGIIMLRNPSSVKKSFRVDVKALLEIPHGYAQDYALKSVYGKDSLSIQLKNDESMTVQMEPYEVIIYEGKIIY